MSALLNRDSPQPLYKQIKHVLVGRIADGTYTDKLPGEVDLAAEFSVARPSVRKALAELVSEDVVTRSPARGTFITESFKPELRSVTCLLYQAGPGDLPPEPMNSPIEREVLAGVAAGAREVGARFDVMLVDFYERGQVLGQLSGLGPADGILACGYMPVVELAVSLGLPAVLCYSPAMAEQPFNSLVYDQDAAGRLIADHVLDCGVADVLYAIAEDPFRGMGARKVALLRETLQRGGVALPADRVLQTSPEPGLASRQVQAYLQEHERPSCIVCSTDFIGAGVIDAINRLGLMVPTDIMVTGYSDFPVARSTAPPLTTVRIPRFELGRQAVHLLKSSVSKDTETPLSKVLPVELVVRESTRVSR